MIANKIEVEKYKNHPRILELRLVLLFNNLMKNYNYDTTMEFFKALCQIFKVNFMNIVTVLNNDFDIRRYSKTNRHRWYQDVVFMAYVYGESRYTVANNYLFVNKATLYRKEYDLNVESFVTEEWLRGLDKSVIICGINNQRLEAERFLQGLEYFLGGLGRVSISKT